jgi:uncharacterized cupin superfamily protein
MSNVTFLNTNLSKVTWLSTPIPAEWIKDGTPIARTAFIFGKSQQLSSAAVWDCTAGTFEWHFGTDETIQILEGEARVWDASGHLASFRAGDFGYFPAGSVSIWHVDRYFCKLAFERQPVPDVVALAVRMTNKARQLVASLI